MVLRLRPVLLGGLLALMGVWAVVSIARAAAAGRAADGVRGRPACSGVLSVVAVALYAYSAWRSVQLYRRRGGAVTFSMAVAFVLLAEAMIAVSLSRNWHASWWEWHVLLLAAFAAIALGARREYRRGGSLSAAFGGLYLEATLARVDRWYRVGGDVGRVRGCPRRVDRARARPTCGAEGASDEELALLSEAAREVRRLDAAFRPYLPSVVAEGIRRRRARMWPRWAARNVRSASCSPTSRASRRSARPAHRPR